MELAVVALALPILTMLISLLDVKPIVILRIRVLNDECESVSLPLLPPQSASRVLRLAPLAPVAALCRRERETLGTCSVGVKAPQPQEDKLSSSGRSC